VNAAHTFAAAVPDDLTPAQAAIAWVAQQEGVSAVIPGARSPEQARSNAAAGAAAPLGAEFESTVRSVYDEYLRAAVHSRW
jgi:aryl-alcohol dehydrogenase-like predicted oxidoreductase